MPSTEPRPFYDLTLDEVMPNYGTLPTDAQVAEYGRLMLSKLIAAGVRPGQRYLVVVPGER